MCTTMILKNCSHQLLKILFRYLEQCFQVIQSMIISFTKKALFCLEMNQKEFQRNLYLLSQRESEFLNSVMPGKGLIHLMWVWRPLSFFQSFSEKQIA